MGVVCEGDRDGASLLQGRCRSYRGQVLPLEGCFLALWEPRPGAMGGGLRGLSRRGRRSYRGMPCILWEPRLGAMGGGVRG